MSQPIAPLDAHLSSTNQITNGSSTPWACPPTYSAWWERAAIEVLKTSHNFNDVRLIVKFFFRDPTIAVDILSKREKPWLDAFLAKLYGNDNIKKCCDFADCKAEEIVDLIRQSQAPQPDPVWDGKWVFSAVYSTDAVTIAKTLDLEIHSAFCNISFEDWVTWSLGSKVDVISKFLDAVVNFRNDLFQYVQQHSKVINKLLLIREALRSRQPLAYWIISTGISRDTSSDLCDALRFFLHLIQRQFAKQHYDVIQMLKHISILETRFTHKILLASDVNWYKPFSTDFFLLEAIQINNPKDLAKSINDFVTQLYFRLSPANALNHGPGLENIDRHWSDLSYDILACLCADSELVDYSLKLAENFIFLLQDYHCAAALGNGLSIWGFQPSKPSPVWTLINPENNFKALRARMAEEQGSYIPYIFPLRQSGIAPGQLLKIFQSCLGITQEAEVGQRTTVNKSSLNQSLCFSSLRSAGQSKRKAMLDLNRGELQQSTQSTKRTKVGNDTPNTNRHNSKPSLSKSDFFHVVLTQESASPERSSLHAPSRNGLLFSPGPAQINVQEPKDELKIHSQVSSLSPNVFSKPAQVLTNPLGLICHNIPPDSFQGLRRAAKMQIANSKEEGSAREQDVLQKARQEQTNNSPTTESLIDSLVQTDNNGPVTDMKLGVESSDALTSSTIPLTTLTSSPCTIPSSLPRVVNTEDKPKVGQDSITPVENVILGESKEDSIRSSAEIISTPVVVKRGRGRPRKYPVPTLQPISKAPKRRSVTGCLTCRRRKKRCDETKPSCMNCEIRGVMCQGFPKTIWKNRKEKKAAQIQNSGLSTITLPPVAQEDVTTPHFGCSMPTQTLGRGETSGDSEEREPGKQTEPKRKIDIKPMLNPENLPRESTNFERESSGTSTERQEAYSPVVVPLSEGQCLTTPPGTTSPDRSVPEFDMLKLSCGPSTSEFHLIYRRADGQKMWRVMEPPKPSDKPEVATEVVSDNEVEAINESSLLHAPRDDAWLRQSATKDECKKAVREWLRDVTKKHLESAKSRGIELSPN